MRAFATLILLAITLASAFGQSGGTITINKSKVPLVVGLTAREADTLLSKKNMRVGKFWIDTTFSNPRYWSECGECVIIKQEPVEGEPYDSDKEITVWLTRGNARLD